MKVEITYIRRCCACGLQTQRDTFKSDAWCIWCNSEQNHQITPLVEATEESS